jgi:hypothetical protein
VETAIAPGRQVLETVAFCCPTVPPFGCSSDREIIITEKHYSAWIKGRQEALEAAIKDTFTAEFAAATDTKPIQSNSTRATILQKSNKNAQK